MKITFTEVHWRNSDDSGIFNIRTIQSIELNTDNSIVTVIGDTGKYKSPFCNLTYGGGLPHFKILCYHPYHMGEYINLTIFERNGAVCVTPYSGELDGWFDYMCRTFVDLT
jgi:hypothetical protein